MPRSAESATTTFALSLFSNVLTSTLLYGTTFSTTRMACAYVHWLSSAFRSSQDRTNLLPSGPVLLVRCRVCRYGRGTVVLQPSLPWPCLAGRCWIPGKCLLVSSQRSGSVSHVNTQRAWLLPSQTRTSVVVSLRAAFSMGFSMV